MNQLRQIVIDKATDRYRCSTGCEVHPEETSVSVAGSLGPGLDRPGGQQGPPNAGKAQPSGDGTATGAYRRSICSVAQPPAIISVPCVAPRRMASWA